MSTRLERRAVYGWEKDVKVVVGISFVVNTYIK